MFAAKLQCLSHTPLMEFISPSESAGAAARAAIETLRADFAAFDPELVFLFAPDHYNGFFYELMPSFCIGVAAAAIGDFGSQAGPLAVPSQLAERCAEAVLDAGVDAAVSHRMQVDHGFAQPLELLAGGVDRVPVIPIFINAVANPMPSFRRSRLLGDAVGRFAAGLNKRVLFLGSGGLSHNPPVPVLRDATPEVAENLIAGRNPTPEARRARQQRVIDAARAFAGGESTLHPLNPEWDRDFLGCLERRELDSLDRVGNDEVSRLAGNSAHEVKAWVAANAAMAAATGGNYRAARGFYAPIPEWIAGFGTLQGDAA